MRGLDQRAFLLCCLKGSWQSMIESRILQELEKISMTRVTRKKLTMIRMRMRAKVTLKELMANQTKIKKCVLVEEQE